MKHLKHIFITLFLILALLVLIDYWLPTRYAEMAETVTAPKQETLYKGWIYRNGRWEYIQVIYETK